MIKEELASRVQESIIACVKDESLGELKSEEVLNKENILEKVVIDKTKKPEFGDYCCNISYLAKAARMAPPKIAEVLVKKLENIRYSYSIIGGFINFTVLPVILSEIINEIESKKDNYGKRNLGENKKVLLEYVSANPTGPLHIGHGRWASLGSCIESIMNFTGYDVKTEFYINDAGVQIRNLGYSLLLRVLKELDPEVYFPLDKESDERAKNFYPGEYLVDIAKLYISQNKEKAESFKQQCQMDGELYVPPEELIIEMAEFAKPIILEQQKQLLEKFKTTFDIWYSETALHKSGKVDGILDYMESKNSIYEKDGAVWFASSRFLDDQDRVIRKSDNTLTYLTADIAYHKDKYDRGYEHLINIWGADHHGYVPRMKSAVAAMGYSPDSLEVIIGQMVNLIIDGEQVRMGKRKKMLTLEDLINDVGVDATRFWMVSRSTDTTLDFDVELAKSASDENPVFYVQYAHARCCSILRNAVAERIDTEKNITLPPLYTKEELQGLLASKKPVSDLFDEKIDNKQRLATKNLILNLETFKDIVIKASRDRAPHYISRYLIDLASCYHSFYSECRVLNMNPSFEIAKELQDARLKLIDATRQILYNGLKLLSVEAPQAM